MTIADDRAAIAAKLATIEHLAHGLGDEHSPCSLGAANLALSGRLTDTPPRCAHAAICSWVIGVQDPAPAEIRDSAEWRAALPLIAGSVDVPDEYVRRVLIAWAWRVLGDPAVVAAVPTDARVAWGAMVAARGDAQLTCAVVAADRALAAVVSVTRAIADADVWHRADLPGTLRALCTPEVTL